MNVISSFTLRSMKLNRKWTIVTLIGIIISTAMLSAVSTLSISFLDLLRNDSISTNGNWYAAVSNVQLQDVQHFALAPFVSEAMLSRDIGFAKLEATQNANKPYLFIKQLDASNKVFPTELIDGRMPQNASELALPEHLMTIGGVNYAIGDIVTFTIGKRTNPSAEEGFTYSYYDGYMGELVFEDGLHRGEVFIPEQTQTYEVVGIIKRPTFERSWAAGFTAVTYLDSSSLNPNDTVTVSLLTGRLRRSFVDDVLHLSNSLGYDAKQVSLNTDLLRYYGVVLNDRDMRFFYGFITVIVVIIVIASISLIYNAFAISVAERISQLGMLASVGATRKQKRWSVYFEGLTLGLIAIPLGVIAGIIGIAITLWAIRPQLDSVLAFTNYGLTLKISPFSVTASVVLAALTILTSVWLPARRASLIMPIDAIRQSKEVRLTKNTVKTARLTRMLFGFEGEIALKNLKRSRNKYRATVLSLVVSLILFLTVSSYVNMIKLTTRAITYGFNYDLAVTYYNMPRGEAEELNNKISTFEHVSEMTMYEYLHGSINASAGQLSELVKRVFPESQGYLSLQTDVYCLDDASFDRYLQSIGQSPADFRDSSNPRAVVINYGRGIFNGKRTGGEILAVNPGELLSIHNITDNDKRVELEVTLTTERPIGVLISPLSTVSVIVSREVYSSMVLHLSNDDPDSTPHVQQLFISSPSNEQLESTLLELTQNISRRTVSVFNASTNNRNQRTIVLVLSVFVYGFISLISLICIANILNTITTNVALRRREFAMLRSVGMTPQSFNRMIRFESVFYGLKALFYGLPLSAIIGWVLFDFQADAFDVGFSLPWVNYGVSIVLIFLIVGSTMLYSSAKIKNENIIDALKTEIM